MSVVQQDPCLYTCSIRENVISVFDNEYYKTIFGLDNPSYEEIESNVMIDKEIDRSSFPPNFANMYAAIYFIFRF